MKRENKIGYKLCYRSISGDYVSLSSRKEVVYQTGKWIYRPKRNDSKNVRNGALCLFKTKEEAENYIRSIILPSHIHSYRIFKCEYYESKECAYCWELMLIDATKGRIYRRCIANECPINTVYADAVKLIEEI